VAGLVFSIFLFGVFSVSEKIVHKRGQVHGELDQFHVAAREDISPQTVGSRPGSILVPVSNYHALYHLDAVLSRLKPTRRDVVVLHVRLLSRAASGESGLTAEQLFSSVEQYLFTQALSLAEKHGKPIRLAMVAANDVWDAMLRAATTLQASAIVLGQSSKTAPAEQARLMGIAWERLPAPRPQINLEIYAPGGKQELFFLGPHAPHLTSNEVALVHRQWLHYSELVAPEELHHHDIVHFAMNEIDRERAEGREAELLERLKQHIEGNKAKRQPPTTG
jgi:hypothetical protein